MNQVRSRGLPEDHAGPIRIIDIEGIDANMCCGTHVSNLSHLQVEIHTHMQTRNLRIIFKTSEAVKVYIHYCTHIYMLYFVGLGVP